MKAFVRYSAKEILWRKYTNSSNIPCIFNFVSNSAHTKNYREKHAVAILAELWILAKTLLGKLYINFIYHWTNLRTKQSTYVRIENSNITDISKTFLFTVTYHFIFWRNRWWTMKYILSIIKDMRLAIAGNKSVYQYTTLLWAA